MEAYVLREREAYRTVAPHIKSPERLAAVLDVHPTDMQKWYQKYIKKARNPVEVVVTKARDYFEQRRNEKQSPADVSQHMYHALADWYAVNVRPHTEKN